MKRPHVYIYKFVNFGSNNDDELEANARSLKSRYKERSEHPHTSVITKVYSGHLVAPTTVDWDGTDANLATWSRGGTTMQSLDAAARSLAPVGVYLLTHVNGSTLEPDATRLANVVFDDLILKGTPVSKINIAGCMGAGKRNKKNQTQSEFASSSLVTFCRQLELRARETNVPLHNRLTVCAYTIYITTYDFRENYYASRQNQLNVDPALTDVDRPARSAHTSGSGGITNYKPTHPRLDSSDLDALEAIISAAWDEMKDSFVARKTEWQPMVKYTYPSLKEKEPECAKAFRQHCGNRIAQKITRDGSDEQKAIWNGMSQYTRYKVVAVIDRLSGRFRVGSISDYTENPYIDRYVTAMDDLTGGLKVTFSIGSDPGEGSSSAFDLGGFPA